MKKLTSFSLGLVMSLIFMSFVAPDEQVVMSSGLDNSISQVQTVTDLTSLIQLILSTIGGIVSTILLAFLRKKFPDYFGPALEAAKERIKVRKKPT